ncbi:hypothetical protein LTR53_000688 [Teratosphaeriaceae sp. CCFEE 6253]|nr:hypothetical protein LTR53_000688 [Teratosphaeriaceae sp. CCFEE 6253]
MVMVLPRPSTSGNRPAYLDNLFRDAPPLPSPGIHSANSSISVASSTGSDLRLNKPLPRPLTPALEDADDRASIRSFSSRFTVRSIFNRRTYPSRKDSVPLASRPTTPLHSYSHPGSRRPSLPRLTTSFSSSSLKLGLVEREKPLPAAPAYVAQELGCHRCYYFAARNCNGWVMGGSHGDSCEQCLQAGFFGAR